MLRASRMYQAIAKSVYRQHGGLLLAKRMETTTTTASATTHSIGKKVVGLVFIGAATYGGAVYYALNDPSFRRTFTTHIPGASEFVSFLEVALADNELGHVEEYWNLAKDYGYKTMDTVNNAYDYANDTYSKLTDTSESKLSGHQNTHDGILTSDKATSTTITMADRPPPILIRRTISDHPRVRELSQLVTELASILNDAGLANAGRDILTRAESQIQQLNTRYQTLDRNHRDVLEQLQQLNIKVDDTVGGLDRLYDDTKVALNATHAATSRALLAKETLMQQESALARQQLESSFSEFLAGELTGLKDQLEREREQSLANQAAELKRMFIRDVKTLVERERAGRLATLDTIAQRFQSIETSSLQNAQALDHARQTHHLFVALSAVQDAVDKPFVDEWETLRHGAGHHEGLKKILASVSRETVEQGIASLGELTSRFDAVADQVRRVALVPENGGFGAHMLSFIMSKLLFKKHGMVEGDDVEAVLARSSYYLQKNDLENAARELNQLQGWPKRLAGGWIASARQHLEVKQALEIVETHIVLSSISDA